MVVSTRGGGILQVIDQVFDFWVRVYAVSVSDGSSVKGSMEKVVICDAVYARVT